LATGAFQTWSTYHSATGAIQTWSIYQPATGAETSSLNPSATGAKTCSSNPSATGAKTGSDLNLILNTPPGRPEKRLRNSPDNYKNQQPPSLRRKNMNNEASRPPPRFLNGKNNFLS
jgi:hypothetical protein